MSHTSLFHKLSLPLTPAGRLLALEKAAHAGMGLGTLLPVGLPQLCPRKPRGVGVTLLLLLHPGFHVFNGTSVSRPEQPTALTYWARPAWVTLPMSGAAPPQQHTLRHFFQAWAGSLMF